MAATQGVDLVALEELRQQHIGRLLLNAQRDYSVRALAKLRARGHEGLTLAHTNVLPHIDLQGTRSTILAERAGVSKQAIGQVIGELEARGHVHRETDPHDRRMAIITFTPLGVQFLRDAHAVKQEIEAEYSALLGEEGMRELRRLLQALVQHEAAS